MGNTAPETREGAGCRGHGIPSPALWPGGLWRGRTPVPQPRWGSSSCPRPGAWGPPGGRDISATDADAVPPRGIFNSEPSFAKAKGKVRLGWPHPAGDKGTRGTFVLGCAGLWGTSSHSPLLPFALQTAPGGYRLLTSSSVRQQFDFPCILILLMANVFVDYCRLRQTGPLPS